MLRSRNERTQVSRHFLPEKTSPAALVPDDSLKPLCNQRLQAVASLLAQDVGPLAAGARPAFEALQQGVMLAPPSAKQFAAFEKSLVTLLADHLPSQGGSKKQRAIDAKKLYRQAVVASLNQQQWTTIERTFRHGDHVYRSVLTPAAQIKLGRADIFKTGYNDQGVSSGASQCMEHATNLWISKFSASDARAERGDAEEKVLFSGVRHGILSPYGLDSRSDRAEGALNRAREVATAALYLSPDKLRTALDTRETIDLALTSTSLLTAFNFAGRTEGSQIKDQQQAWMTLSQQKPCILEVRDGAGMIRKVSVNLEVAAFNLGVNEAALKMNLGWAQSDALNEKGLTTLLGADLKPGAKDGGWVGQYLAHAPSAASAERVRELSVQIRAIWQAKSHHRDGGEPYQLAQRIALLSHEIGVVPCYNCKSGKDRTGMLDSELKREAVNLHCGKGLSRPNAPLSADQKALFHKVLQHSGNLEIQEKNTGAPGNKVLRKPSLFGLNLSHAGRIGDPDVFARVQRFAPLVKS